jgi:major vault protein
VKKTLTAEILTFKESLHLQAKSSYTDIYGIGRKAGDECLVTHDMSETHIVDVYEKKIDKVPSITLSSR